MNLVPVDPEKNIKNVVEVYKKKKIKANAIKAIELDNINLFDLNKL